MQNLNRLPLSALRAVEAIGRLGTLARAADELGVTVGAVSQRLAKAEARLDRPLFLRRPAGLDPTEDLARVLPRLTLGMEHLASALAQLDQEDASLTVSVAPIFASRWLIWRIHRFHMREPSIRVRVEPRVEIVDFRTAAVDVGIRVGPTAGAHVVASKLLDQRVFPICTPDIARTISGPEDLFTHPIIRETDDLYGWQLWLASKGLPMPQIPAGPTYTDASLCLDAAMTGQGIFMAWETLACDVLKTGQLAAPLPGRCETGNSYWLVTGPRAAGTRKIRVFERWLRDELERSVREWGADDRETGRSPQ